MGDWGGGDGPGSSCVFSLELSFEGLAHFLPLGRPLEVVWMLGRASIPPPSCHLSSALLGLIIPSDSSLAELHQCRVTIQIALTCGGASSSQPLR